jgi:photosystem II stability/assembly factor-like uncharacterized protein
VAIVRTSDADRHFVAVPAPRVRYEQAGCPYVPVSRILFADARDGFAFDCALYSTHDGGAHWRKIDLGGFVTELATADGNAYAIVSNASGTQNTLMRSPVAHDDWMRLPAAGNVDGGLTARAGHVLVQSASGALLLSHDDGDSFQHSNSFGLGQPCTLQEVAPVTVWAFCGGGTLGQVMRSTDRGRSFQVVDGGTEGAGASGEYHGAVFAATSPTTAIVGFEQLLRTSDAGSSYQPVGPAGLEWEQLVFTDSDHWVTLAAPPGSAPVGSRVYTTTDGGRTFGLVKVR